ncbi:unnamed protein product [Adineta ricciae]|uniref:Cytochrome b561 domain-containing protein n=1 Tax=Adineta ricciae TaxID=249248 RepID=A0A813VNU5_ADIRI|nr:unnamed protein product [Adineta ricciae]CAF1036296.1 unnamed protein product [Adineta ricciae]
MGKGNFDEIGSTRASIRWYYFIAICAQIFGVTAVILIGVLLGQYAGGFGWGSNLDKLFNYHPLLMVLGMILFYGDAILVYRVFPNVTKIWIKILHAVLLAASLILSSIGLKAVFDSHSKAKPPQEDLDSLHSWVGLATVVLFGLQWVCGFVAFLFPRLSEKIRVAYLPSHKLWGKLIFILAVVSVLMGTAEEGIFKNYSFDKNMRTQRNILNLFGICVLIFAALVLYLVSNPGFQRPPDHTDASENQPLMSE